MSAYNAERFLKDAVDSVLAQSLQDFELLIFEDCSTDRSREILQSYRDQRIRLELNNQNSGLAANLVRGMGIARGDYLARMDADDICEHDRLAKQADYLDKHSDIGLLGSAVDFFDENGSLGIAYQPEDHDSIKCALFLGFTLLHPSVMMRIGAFRDHGLNYDSTFRYSEDHDLWVRACRCLRVANLREPLLRMRTHNASWTRTEPDGFSQYSSRIRKRQLEELGVDYTADEMAAFDWGASPDGRVPPAGVLEMYDALGMKILAANSERHIFNQDVLSRLLGVTFHRLCSVHLKDGRRSGAYYWRSALRKHHKLTPRQWSGLVWRSFKF